MVAPAAPSSAIWSRRGDEITFDRLHKFWSALSPHQRNELLRLDKHTLIERARKNLYCSRCNGLLLENFAQIVMYGKPLHQEGLGEPKIQEVEAEEIQDPSFHPWGGLSTTEDGILTVLDCFINAKSLHVLQNVFDNARAREREREMLYPDACGGGGRGWISPVIPTYGRGHGTRDTCALHTARLSSDTLVDFWSALGEETRSSLLRMKEEDFIERLMHRFDSKRFCRDCRRNVIREFKELKELKRMRKEPRCTGWFCVADTAFMCEVFEDAVLVDWHQSVMMQDESYCRFEWAIGTDEGKSDILDFENVGLKGQVHRKGLDLDEFEDYFVTLRAWKLDGRCTEFCVKAHALKGQSCVHRRLIVGDGFVTITKGESIRSFFEYAEEAEEEDEDDTMDRDGNDPDSDAVHPQKHAKSPELAREFLLDAAVVIFKEQVEKAFREGTARQNAHSVFVSLALKLLEERVHVACKEIITLEKQTKLLEEEEKEKREEEERRERRRIKEREKKHRRKERLKEKDKDKEKTVVQSKTSDDIPPSLSKPVTPSNTQSQDIDDSRYSSSEDEGVVLENYCPDDSCVNQSSSRETAEQNNEYQCNTAAEFVPTDCNDTSLCEEKSSRRNLRFRRDSTQELDNSYWYEDCQDDSGDIGDIQCQSRERRRNGTRGYNSIFSANNRTRDRYDPCSCGHQEDYRYFSTVVRPSREMKMVRKTVAEKSRLQYRRCYPLDSFVGSKGGRVGGTPNRNASPKQVWEPMDARKRASFENANNATEADNEADQSNQLECSKDINGCQKIETGCESLSEVCAKRSEESCKSDTDQPCEGEKNRAAGNNESHVGDKTDCCLTKDTGRAANLIGSDSSSCLSEGDRDSSVSSMTSLSAQNAESSSTSDSEESSERNSNSPGDPPPKNSSRSLLEMCAGNGFREFKPKSIQPSDSNQIGFGIVAPFQDQLLHHQKVQVPLYSSTIMGFRSHPLSVPTNGYIPYPQPAHFYPSPVGYGVAGSQCVDFPLQYSNNIHPYSGSEFSYVQPQPVHKTPVSFHAVPPSPPCRNGAQVVMNAGRLQNHVFAASNIAVPPNGCSEDNTKQKDGDCTPFSLFQFNLPIAPLAPVSSKEEKCGGAMASMPPIAQGQSCSREETNVKEYNLFFGGCARVIFPFD